MKRKLFIAAVAAVALAACEEKINEQTVSADEMVELKISIPSAVTKVSEKNEPGTPAAVHSLQVFLFDEEGNLETSDIQEKESLGLPCVPGKKKVVAIVNAPELSGVTSLTSLTSMTSKLSDNTIESMVMEGSVDIEVTANTSVTIPVSRLAAKVVLRTVINSFELLTHQQMEFQVTAVYLVNVAGEKTYMTDDMPELWYNKMKNEEDEQAPNFICDKLTSQIIIPYNGTYTADKYYYCYPNPTTKDSSEEVWSERYTRLVVEALLGGEKLYYPITIPNVTKNTAYEISLKVTRPGSDSPDVPVSGHVAEFKIQVQDWITGELIEEII